MRTVKYLVGVVAISIMIGCGNDVPPRFRLQNGALEKASVQIKTSDGNTININNVDPGYISEYQESSEGRIDITATVQSDTTKYLNNFNAYNNEKYTIRVLNPPGIRIDSP